MSSVNWNPLSSWVMRTRTSGGSADMDVTSTAPMGLSRGMARLGKSARFSRSHAIYSYCSDICSRHPWYAMSRATFARNAKETRPTSSPKITKASRTQSGPDYERRPVIHLQKTIGNQAVQRLLRSKTEDFEADSASNQSTAFPHDSRGYGYSKISVQRPTTKPIQTKLTVGQPGDRFEREANQLADSIIRHQDQQGQQRIRAPWDQNFSIPQRYIRYNGGIRRQPVDVFVLEEEDGEEAQGVIRTKETAGSVPTISPWTEAQLDSLQDGGRPLHRSESGFFEPYFGYDFSQVRIHTDPLADQTARALHARAFTWGNHIVFRAGEYAPDQRTGKHLLAHELVHVIQQRAVSPRQATNEAHSSPSLTTPQSMLQKKDCNFYVYDSTETEPIGTAWRMGARARALAARGGYAIGSSHTIEYMLTRVLRKFSNEGCDCVEEIQFWSHGSSANAMYIVKTGDEITAADFNIPGLEKYGQFPGLGDMIHNPRYYQAWTEWFNKLSWRQQLLVELRSYICGPNAQIYYRSCSAFHGKEGQEFAEKSATFWQSRVVGHTKTIGLNQPGKKVLKPGQEPYWPESEGPEAEMKKRGSKRKKD